MWYVCHQTICMQKQTEVERTRVRHTYQPCTSKTGAFFTITADRDAQATLRHPADVSLISINHFAS
jgi:hypothetical protein